MGRFFRMSNRFNKSKPCDFGLVEMQKDSCAVDPEDGSQWLPCSLFDFGWGEENGFYKVPLPKYRELLKIVLESEDYDDVYGAAAIILEKYPDDLLSSCEELFSSEHSDIKFKLTSIFQLQLCINRSKIQGKTYREILDDTNRWHAIGKAVSQGTVNSKITW